MVCEPTNAGSEWEFVRALATRNRDVGECRGPLLDLTLPPWRSLSLVRICDSAVAASLLWSGHVPEKAAGNIFALCAAHWLDLACLCWMRSQQKRRVDWAAEADELLDDLCTAAGWDEKEIVNMFAWQQARLT